MKVAFALILATLVLLTVPAYAQAFPPLGDDTTSSLGSFQIKTTPKFSALVANCPGFVAKPLSPPPVTNGLLSSPTLYDPSTVIGRSAGFKDGDAVDTGGAVVGTAGTLIRENIMSAPPGFPCYPPAAGCLSGPGTREIHTEVRSLRMSLLGHPAGTPPAVRAGVWYNSAAMKTVPPARISPGEIESKSGPNGLPDLPGSSFYDIFAEVDLPACPGFPGGTLYNTVPLIVKNPTVPAPLPPKVVYLHDTSTTVPILMLNANPPLWNKDDIFGYFVLAGHGIGFTSSPSDVTTFQNYMSCLASQIGTAAPATVCTVGAAPQ